MEENEKTQISKQQSNPNPDLKSLEKLVGTWKVSGGIEGTNTFEWTEGGFFLIQHFDFERGGHSIKGIEIIGHELNFGEEPSAEIKSRVYSFLDGMTLNYIYEMDGDALTIWAGEKNSPAFYKGELSDNGNTMTGEWTYPGGGYQATGIRVK